MPVHISLSGDALEKVRSEIVPLAKSVFQLKTPVGKKPGSLLSFSGVSEESAKKFIDTVTSLDSSIHITVSGNMESLKTLFPNIPVPQQGVASGLTVRFSKDHGAFWRGSFRTKASVSPISFIDDKKKITVRGKVNTNLISGHELWKAESFLNQNLTELNGYVSGGKEGSLTALPLGSSLSFQFSVTSSELGIVLRTLCSLPCAKDVSMSFYHKDTDSNCSLLWRQTEKKSMFVAIA